MAFETSDTKLDDLVRYLADAYPVVLGRACPIPPADVRAELRRALERFEPADLRVRAILGLALEEARVASRPLEGFDFLRRFRLREELEPFGIVVLEAWAAGKPVVATNHGGPGEIVWHGVNGLKIYAHAESVAWGVGNMFRDFEAARWMGRNGRVAAETAFTWDKIAEQTLGVYQSI